MFYFLIVVFGIVLLAVAQLRSSGGAAFDTWRLNYEANRVLKDILVSNLKKANEKAREDTNSLTGNEASLRLFDESGVPKKALIDEETAKEVAQARQQNTNPSHLNGDVHYLVKGYSWVQNDISYYRNLVQEDGAEVDDLKDSLTKNSEQYAELIKGREDFLAFTEMEKSWDERPFVVLRTTC